MVLTSKENIPQIQLGSSPQKFQAERDDLKTAPPETQENKPDRKSLNLPLKSINTTTSQQSDVSFWPAEKSPKSSTPRQSIDPAADLPNYSLLSVVGNSDKKEDENKNETTVEEEGNTTVIERKRSSNVTTHRSGSFVPKDWYYDLQVRLDSLIWKYQNLDQEYAFLQKIAGEQYDDVRKLADNAAKLSEEN